METPKWENITKTGEGFSTLRWQVPNGWLVRTVTEGRESLCFYPDAKHEWKV